MALSQRRRRLLGRLLHRKTRMREGRVLVEGARAAAEALAARVDLEFACVSPRLDEIEGGAVLREALDGAGVEVASLADAELRRLSDTEHPQGILLVARQPHQEVSALASGGRYLVLDAIQDPGNVGTLVRSSVAFDLDAVLTLDGTADPWSPKAVRASAGLVFRLPVHILDVTVALELLRAAAIELLVAEPGGGDVLDEPPGGGWALVVGNEGSGVRAQVRAAGARNVAIRMPGPAESLNAGVAGAILLHALSRAPTAEKNHA